MQDGNWYLHTINSANDRTVGHSTSHVTISTDGTTSESTLHGGENFHVGGTVYTYEGSATVGTVSGFYAKSGHSSFFFSKTDVGNQHVAFSAADTPICFFPGTLIQAPAGEVAVEALAIGDLVLTADGNAVPVRWLGRQSVSTLFADPLRTLPIRILAGALGDKLPVRDLLVSADHAILVQGVLVQAGALVNGSTIRREADVPERFTYYHVELANHALILADGVPAETFVDNVQRLAFDNWDEHEALYGALPSIPEMNRARAKSHRQVPWAVRRHIEARAAALAGAAICAA